MKLRHKIDGTFIESNNVECEENKFVVYCKDIFNERFYLYTDIWEEVKETETEWHDLRKNPKDVPKHEEDVLCYGRYVDSDNKPIGECRYFIDAYYCDQWQLDCEYLAWREMPKYPGTVCDDEINFAVKWHDLQKDPSDLPKPMSDYGISCSRCVVIELEDGFIDIAYYDYGEGCWFKGDEPISGVVAWCDVPRRRIKN